MVLEELKGACLGLAPALDKSGQKAEQAQKGLWTQMSTQWCKAGKQTKTGQQSQKEISSTAVKLNASMCQMLVGLSPCLWPQLRCGAAHRCKRICSEGLTVHRELLLEPDVPTSGRLQLGRVLKIANFVKRSWYKSAFSRQIVHF